MWPSSMTADWALLPGFVGFWASFDNASTQAAMTLEN